MKKLIVCISAIVFAAATTFSQNVNQFTGDFTYSVPLFTVPSPDGPGIPISVSYRSGIGVNQPASEVGLGWDINAGGMISRSVNSTADDWKNAIIPNINNVTTISPSPQTGAFEQYSGLLNFRDYGTGGEYGVTYNANDFYTSNYKIPYAISAMNDTVKKNPPVFNFPDYDTYYVSGAGLMGRIEPRLFDYVMVSKTGGNFEPGGCDMNHNTEFTKKPQFTFVGDFAGTLTSSYYPTYSNSGTPLRLPPPPECYTSAPIAPAYYGTGYNKESYGELVNKNRLISNQYIEYFTNYEINYHFNAGGASTNTAMQGFVDYKPTTHTRSSGGGFDMTGIGAFRITDPDGLTYHYSLPVYVNSTIQGTLPLNNDYSPQNYGFQKTTGIPGGLYSYFPNKDSVTTAYNGSYIFNDQAVVNDGGDAIGLRGVRTLEIKTDKKYAYNWLLTAVTGPGYSDENENGIADTGDKGYWVSYDWQKWSENFLSRDPLYGFNTMYNSTDDGYSTDMEIDLTENYDPDFVGEAMKVSGKVGTYTKFNKQIYYLNKIQTSTHTALFIRDIRDDEHSSHTNYDNKFPGNLTLGDIDSRLVYPAPFGGDTTIIFPTQTSLSGVLYDEGGPWGDMPSEWSGCPSGPCGKVHDLTVTIAPTGADKVELDFQEYDITYGNGITVEIYNGTNPTPVAILGSCASCTPTDLFGSTKYTSTASSVKIKVNVTTTSMNLDPGFKINWNARYTNGQAKVVPQLKLSKMVLMRNEEFGTLDAPSNITTANPLWDLTPTTTAATFYSYAWYTTNKTDIEAASLKTIDFNQNYSLARKYYNNINVTNTNGYKSTSPVNIKSGTTIPSADSAVKYPKSGKLTLNEIISYEVNHKKISPSVVFRYDISNSTSNPDYNPLAMDFWGYYKSDATAKGLSSYPTATSKDNVDAWSLRKITSPLGGVLEIEYESDSYEKVLSDEDNIEFKGPVRMYAIETAIPHNLGTPTVANGWKITMEDEVSDIKSLLVSPPVGTTGQLFIPYSNLIPANNYSGTRWINTGEINCDGGSSGFVISTASSHVVTNAIGTGTALFQQDITDTYYVTYTDDSIYDYTGSGYMFFQLPVGTTVYGGGTRVKTLTVKNSSDEAYVTEYTYTGGVATSEPSAYNKPLQKLGNDNNPYELKLLALDHDKHKLPDQVGYTSVTAKNKGRDTNSNGEVISTFLTSDKDIDNFKPFVKVFSAAATAGPGCGVRGIMDTSYVIDVSDKFSAFWGKPLEIKVKDMNNNVISRVKNTYENVNQGSIVENYVFKSSKFFPTLGDIDNSCTQYFHTVCILRNYPVVQTQQINYGKGGNTTTDYITFDNITGLPTTVSTTDMSKAITVDAVNICAFRVPSYSKMASKAVTYTNKNKLTLPFSSVIAKQLDNGSSTFAVGEVSRSVQTYNTNVYERNYNTGSSLYVTSNAYNPNWTAGKSYQWKGPLNTYGLLSDSIADFDTTGININADVQDPLWRYSSQITLLDQKQRVLETRSFTNKFSATKYGQNDLFPIAQANNVNYVSFTHCGFEEVVNSIYSSGEANIGSSTNIIRNTLLNPIKAHTGTGYLKLESEESQAIYKASTGATIDSLLTGRIYRASVWVHSESNDGATLSVQLVGDVAGSPYSQTVSIAKTDASAIVSGDWKLLNLDIEVPYRYYSTDPGDGLIVTLQTGEGDAYFDDLRLHPVEANLTANVYEEKTGRVIATLNNNNFGTVNEYDEGGRIKAIWQEVEGHGFKKIKTYSYNYAR